MFGVDECRQPASLLGIGDHMQHQSSFTGRFRAENLNHAATRNPAHAQRQVHRQRAGGNHFDLLQCTGITQAHDAPIPIGFGDRGNSGLEIALTSGGNFGRFGNFAIRSGGFFNGLFNSLGRHNSISRNSGSR